MKRKELSIEEAQRELFNSLHGGWLDCAVIHSIQVRLIYYFDASDISVEIDVLCSAAVVTTDFHQDDQELDFSTGRSQFLARLPDLMGLTVVAASFNQRGELELACDDVRAVFWASEDDAASDEWAWRITVREGGRVLREIVYSLDERRSVLLIEPT